MRSGAYEQHRISNGPLSNFDAVYSVRMSARPSILADGRFFIDTRFRIIDLSSGSNYHDDYMSVYGDSIITIKLHKSIKWRWSKKNDAITTKGELSYFYGNLKYARSANATEDSYDIISFEARFDKYGQVNTKHGVSLNVEFLQKDGKWLEMTIDPDIPNPPPTKGRTAGDAIPAINEDDDEFEIPNGKEGVLFSGV